MSALAISAGVAGTPSPGPFGGAGRCCARTTVQTVSTVSSAMSLAARLDIDIADLAIGRHAPTLHTVEVIAMRGATRIEEGLS